MDPKRYFTYSIIGGILWAAGITVLGSLMGNISFVRNHVDLIFVVIVLVSVLPIVAEYFKARKEKKLAGIDSVAMAGTPTEMPGENNAEVTQQFPRIDS
jgi:membrane-associated protein